MQQRAARLACSGEHAGGGGKAAPTAAKLVAAAQVAGRLADSAAAIDGACCDSIAADKALPGSWVLRRAARCEIQNRSDMTMKQKQFLVEASTLEERQLNAVGAWPLDEPPVPFSGRRSRCTVH